jgi:hypothetical protein
MIAFAGAAYQNRAAICAQHHMLLPRGAPADRRS